MLTEPAARRAVGTRARDADGVGPTRLEGDHSTVSLVSPRHLDQVIGQEHVTEPLARGAARESRDTRVPVLGAARRARTSARILARCSNCAQGPGHPAVGANPAASHTGAPVCLDVEIDAASHGGVDDARDLRERATFAPVRDR